MMLNKEYDRLALDTSNMMMHHDGSRVRGVSSLEYMNMAGYGRMRMSMIAERAESFAVAIGDAMSAHECFVLAENWKMAVEMTHSMRKLIGAYGIPEARGDMKRREKEIEARYKEIAMKYEESENAG
jgi:hypothetical protein